MPAGAGARHVLGHVLVSILVLVSVSVFVFPCVSPCFSPSQSGSRLPQSGSRSSQSSSGSSQVGHCPSQSWTRRCRGSGCAQSCVCSSRSRGRRCRDNGLCQFVLSLFVPVLVVLVLVLSLFSFVLFFFLFWFVLFFLSPFLSWFGLCPCSRPCSCSCSCLRPCPCSCLCSYSALSLSGRSQSCIPQLLCAPCASPCGSCPPQLGSSWSSAFVLASVASAFSGGYGGVRLCSLGYPDSLSLWGCAAGCRAGSSRRLDVALLALGGCSLLGSCLGCLPLICQDLVRSLCRLTVCICMLEANGSADLVVVVIGVGVFDLCQWGPGLSRGTLEFQSHRHIGLRSNTPRAIDLQICRHMIELLIARGGPECGKGIVACQPEATAEAVSLGIFSRMSSVICPCGVRALYGAGPMPAVGGIRGSNQNSSRRATPPISEKGFGGGALHNPPGVV